MLSLAFREKHHWDDKDLDHTEIRLDCISWINLAQERDHLRVLVKAAIHPRVS
jgi:hypothetical protein